MIKSALFCVLQDIRKDFIRNEVGNWSLGKHIYGYRIKVRIHGPLSSRQMKM